MMGEKALEWVCDQKPANILDIGSGTGEHAAHMRAAGHIVTTLSLIPPADIVGDYMNVDIKSSRMEIIWCCHCLEHIRNPGAFLEKCHLDLALGGHLVITVPPAKHNIVGGHVSLWNMGLLFYHLILAGFDCSEAMGIEHGYNITIVVRKGKRIDLDSIPLTMDIGDIEHLSQYFPFQARQNFDGNIKQVNWRMK